MADSKYNKLTMKLMEYRVLFKACLIISSLIIISCDSKRKEDKEIHTFLAKAGKIYQIVFANDDGVKEGEKFDTADKLKNSPLGNMYKKAFIIKADDFRCPLNEYQKEFINIIKEYNAKCCFGLITNTLDTSQEGTEELKNLLKDRRFELFLHGWNHWISPNYKLDNQAEFQNVGYEYQYNQLVKGIEAVKKHLGYTPHSFGTPGNAIDTDTRRAILANPDIKIWFFGMDDPENRYWTVTGNLDLEIECRRLEEIDVLIKRYEAKKEEQLLLTQIHPGWIRGEKDMHIFKMFIAYVHNDNSRSFFTPWEYHTWTIDKPNITLRKANKTTYILNMKQAQYEHQIQFSSKDPVTVRELSGGEKQEE